MAFRVLRGIKSVTRYTAPTNITNLGGTRRSRFDIDHTNTYTTIPEPEIRWTEPPGDFLLRDSNGENEVLTSGVPSYEGQVTFYMHPDIYMPSMYIARENPSTLELEWVQVILNTTPIDARTGKPFDHTTELYPEP